jgi:hypothetical protein
MDMRATASYAASWTTEGTSGETTLTEQEWLTCTDPQLMLDEVLFDRVEANERQMRLFAVACCRRVWHFIADERARRAVEVAELYADDLATEEAIEEAQKATASVRQRGGIAAKWAAVAWAPTGARMVVDAAGHTAAFPPGRDYDPLKRQAESDEQCKLLRDIFGDPFRSVTITPAVLAWNDAIIIRLAQATYEERHLPAGTLDNGRLAVLADALEEAGCTDADILDHLRGPGPHVRGCWAVDLCLGKS